MTKFADLNLSDNILKAVNDKGYEIPSPIQAKAIPAIMTGRDVLAAAQTGTGKTAGFTLPIIQKLEKQGPLKHRYTRVLILTPTRELAAQVQNNIEEYAKYTDINSTVVFGGVGINPQKEKLKRGVDILVATPGRLLDLHQQGAARLNYVKTFVLDEADRMLDMGFVNDIRKVETLISEERQTLLFSATFSKEIRQLTKQFLKNPIEIKVAAQNTAAELVDQRAYRCDVKSKTDLCVELIDKGNWEQVLIFTRTKHGANRLTQRLNKANIHASAIHGDKSQGARTKALAGFKAGNIRVLVATDIAARGIDISQLPHVINFELPNVPEDYVHRIGRTGRAGVEGEAISLVCNEERPFLTDIEKLIKQDIELITLDGFEPGEWPDKAPTTKEVLRIAEKRKQANRQSRGPRRDPRQGGNKSGGSSNSGKSKGRRSNNKKKSSNAYNRHK